MELTKVLKVLKTERQITSDWITKLEKAGLEIKYGAYSYWNNQEYIQIGTKYIWLVEQYNCNNSMGCKYRFRNDVVKDIINAIENQYNQIIKEEQEEEYMFKLLANQ